MTDAKREPSALDKLLGLFSKVEAGEGGKALLMTLNIFLVLLSYYIIKVAREPLIIAIEPQTFLGIALPGGAELKSYGAAGQALVLMAYVPFYSWFSSRVDRMRLIVGVILFFTSNIVLFAFGVKLHPLVGFLFFVWCGIFSLSVIAQFWSYANDVYTKDQGDRLFPIIGIGMVAGAPAGSYVAGKLFDMKLGETIIMFVAAGVLLVHLGLFLFIDRFSSAAEAEDSTKEPPKKLEGPGGFALIFRSKYLLLIAGLLLVLNLVNTTGEFILSAKVKEAAVAAVSGDEIKAYIGSFYGDFFFVVNIIAFVIQSVVVSRLVKFTGIKGVVLLLPFISLGAYALIAAGVGLSVLRWAKTAENSTDYSVMNTAKSMLWLPTSREEKYKAKQTIDTFVVRIGDLLSAGVVWLGLNVLALDATGFAMANVGFVAVWLVIGFALVKKHAEISPDEPAKQS